MGGEGLSSNIGGSRNGFFITKGYIAITTQYYLFTTGRTMFVLVVVVAVAATADFMTLDGAHCQ